MGGRTAERFGEPRAGAPSCLLCGGTRHRVVFHELEVDVLRCRGCGHVFSAFPADPHFARYWGESDALPQGDQAFFWDQAHAPMYAAFFRRFLAGRGGRLLDVGCGLGFFVRAVGRLGGWEAWGCEISPAAVRYAREKLGLSNVLCGRLEDAPLATRSFDVITLWDVIEHLSAPDPLLRRCAELLADDGFLFLHTPNARVALAKARLLRWLRGSPPGASYLAARDHVHLYSEAGLCRLLARNGLGRVRFAHLPPIQSVAGSRSALQRLAKNAWFGGARALAAASAGQLNLDNLFAQARRG
jgi:SAM-dependent methyltransferase